MKRRGNRGQNDDPGQRRTVKIKNGFDNLEHSIDKRTLPLYAQSD